MMPYFKTVQFFPVFLILLIDPVCSSYLDGAFKEKDNNTNFFLLNVTNSKYQHEKYEYDISEENNFSLKQETNRITAGSNSKERRLSVISGYKSRLSTLKCGATVDMCGECGGARVDRCNVCAGDNRCVSCNVGLPDHQTDACGNCLPPSDPSWNNCSAVISVHPLVLDKAVSSSGELKLELSRALEEDESLECLVLQKDLIVNASVTAVEETLVTLSVPLHQLMSEARLQCDGWTVPKHPLIVVNSLSLSISSVSPSNISLGVQTQLKLMVHGVSAPVDLFCFLMDQNQTILTIEPTNQVAGNPVSSTVVCSVTLIHPSHSELSVGVAFSRAAVNRMSTNNTIRLSLLPTPLIPLHADFSEDLGHVWVEFGQNIDGPSDCSGVFKMSSLKSLGSGIKCEYRGNNLVVKLGQGATVRPRDILRLSQNADPATGLRLAGTSIPPHLTQDSVHLPLSQKPLPEYLVVGPSKLCQPSYTSVVVVPLTGQALCYNWSLNLVELQPWAQPEQRQRRNLLVWLGARQILRPARHDNLDSLPINSSLLMPNINYRIEVVARNMLGSAGPPVRLNMQLTDTNAGSSLALVILSPAATTASQCLPLELAVTPGCGHFPLDQVKFQWRLARESHTMTLDSSWLKAIVPGSMLQTTGLYNITCAMMNNSDIITQAESQVLVRPAKIELNVVPATLVLGTGHSLILDVTKSLQGVNISSLQITWTCIGAERQECTSAGSEQPVSITHKSVLDRPKLVLPPGSLPVGRYRWVVVVRQPGAEYSSCAKVEVVGGHPPLLTVGPASLSPHLTLPASARGLRPGCRLQWASIPSLGYNYLPLSNVSGSERELSTGTRGDLPLKVHVRMLQPGARYRLRFSASCSAAESAFADFVVPVEPVPDTEALKVSPLQGEALVTQFNFSTKRTTQFGSIYSFGFYSSSGSPLFFYSSAYCPSTTTILPAFSATGSQVKTSVRVCSSKQICSSRDGPVIQTSLPSSLSSQQIRALSQQVSAAMEKGDPSEAVTLVTSILSTTKLFKDQTAYQSLLTRVTEATLQRINLTSQRLEKDISSRPNAILILDSVTRVLPLLHLNDSALSTVVTFRDKLASTSKPPSKPTRLIDSPLPMEPRATRGKRQQPIPAEAPSETPDTVEIWLRTSEAAILSFSPSKSVEEKQKLVKNLDSYVTGLCQWLPDQQPVYLGSRVVNLSVQKLSIEENFPKLKTINVPNCPEKCEPPPAKVFLEKDFISVFKKANVEHICLAGFQFPSGSLDGVFSSPTGSVQLSAVYRLKLLIYSVRDTLGDKPSPGVSLVIPLQSSSPSTQHTIKCCTLKSNTWATERCETLKVNESTVTCKCPPYEYYSVFAVLIPTTTTTTTTEMTTSVATTTRTEPPSSTTTEVATTTTAATTTSPPQTTTAPSTTSTIPSTKSTSPPSSTTPTPLPIKMTTEASQPAKMVAFRIAERFNRVVGQNATDFSNLIKKQLIEQLSLPLEVIQDIYVTEGSILVTLALRNTQQLSAEECVMELAQALDTGQLNLRTANNQPLDVPRQPLQVLRQQSGEQSGLSAVFLASATLVLCGLVVVYVTLVALASRQSRMQETVRGVQRKAAEKAPKYSTFPLPHTLDGSSFRQGAWSGEDLDSGIYGSDGAKRNTMGKTPKQSGLQTTKF